MVQLLNYSPAFRDLIRDVFSGSQDYRSLKRRLWNQLGITVAEFTRSFLDPRTMRCPQTSRPARPIAANRRNEAASQATQAAPPSKKAKVPPNRQRAAEHKLPRIGLEAALERVIPHEWTIAAYDPRLPAVLSTPAMIGMMEVAAANAVQPELPPGAITVGTRIEVDHLKAVPEGSTVRATARLVNTQGPLLGLRRGSSFNGNLLGRGRVFRAIVEPAQIPRPRRRAEGFVTKDP